MVLQGTWQTKALNLHYQSTYGHQIRQDVNLPWGAPTHQVTRPFSTWFLRSCEKVKFLSPIPQHLWPPNLLEWWLTSGASKRKIVYHFDLVVLQGHRTNKNHYISTTRVSMATKLGMMVTYLDGPLPIKSHDPFIVQYCEITWKNETSVYPILQCLWRPNLVGSWLSLNGP